MGEERPPIDVGPDLPVRRRAHDVRVRAPAAATGSRARGGCLRPLAGCVPHSLPQPLALALALAVEPDTVEVDGDADADADGDAPVDEPRPLGVVTRDADDVDAVPATSGHAVPHAMIGGTAIRSVLTLCDQG